MAKTGEHLKIKQMGDNVLGVELEGNPKKPEPIHFRVKFPGGSIEVVRTTDDQYWAHVNVNHPERSERFKGDGVQDGFLTDARIDSLNKHAADMDPGDFADPGLYHLAVRVASTLPGCPDCDGQGQPLGDQDPEELTKCGNCKGWY
jgi:hypothetical protein